MYLTESHREPAFSKYGMKTSSSGLALIQQFEGTKLKAYQDSVGIWTIGVGHTGPGVRSGLTITEEQARAYLMADLAAAEYAINTAVKVALTQNMFDGLASFVFNVGATNFRSSTLLKLLNQYDYKGAEGEFIKWDHAGHEVLPGLLARREAEAELFAKS